MHHEGSFIELTLKTAASVALATMLLLVGFGITHIHADLGVFIFCIAPCITGCALPFITNGIGLTYDNLFTTLILSCAILLFTGYEGIACVLMAFPILLCAIGAGALIGHCIRITA